MRSFTRDGFVLSLTKHIPPGYKSRRMKRATNQQNLITAVFEAAQRATNDLTHLAPDLNRDRTEYAVASLLLEEVWVSGL